jgi:hypothetical protein
MAPRTSGSSKQNPIEPVIPGGGTPTEGVVAPPADQEQGKPAEQPTEPTEPVNPPQGGVTPPDQDSASQPSPKAPPPPPGFREPPQPRKRR